MKKVKILLAAFALFVLLSFAALSQLNAPIINTITKNSQITPSISLEERDICTTEFYDETQDIYGNCVYYNNVTSCTNISGPNTGCATQQTMKNFECVIGTAIVTKNKTACRPNNNFIITINQGTATLKKQINYADWGPCIYAQENIGGNSCLIVTCQSIYDGANDGQFHGCTGGTSCQRFEICDSNVKILYKNSRKDFVEDDPSFHLNKLSIMEAGE